MHSVILRGNARNNFGEIQGEISGENLKEGFVGFLQKPMNSCWVFWMNP